MIQLGNFIAICIGIIIYIIWSYYSIKDVIKKYNTYKGLTLYCFLYMTLHGASIIILIMYVICYYGSQLLNYLNQYTIP